MPILRAAVRMEWPEAQHLAKTRLGDSSLASQLMEEAIEQTKEHLETVPMVGIDEAREILARYYRNAVQRWSRSQKRFVYSGATNEIEALTRPVPPQTESVEARIDLKTMLKDTSPDLRRALLLRYGARGRWDEVAEEVSKSTDSVRMSCQREMSRIRKKLGIQKRTG